MLEKIKVSCPECSRDDVAIARDMKATRMCQECGHSWLPKNDTVKSTKVFLDKFKGNTMFSIWEVDGNGDKISEYPVINFGKRKAQVILKHIEEFKKYVEGE